MRPQSPASIEAWNRWIARLAALLMVAVAGLAFVVSFEAIRSFAARSGAIASSFAWAIPPLVDLPIAIASLVLLGRSLEGERAWFAGTVLVLAAAGSLALNVAHAPHRIGAWAVALIAPAALVVSIELLMDELRRWVRRWRSPSPTPDAPPDGAAELGPVLPVVASIVRARELDGGQLTGASLSRSLAEQGIELPDRDARRLLAVLRLPSDRTGAEAGAAAVHQNGSDPGKAPAEPA
jgi:hypothetical protein